MRIENDTLVLYQGGGYSGCYWEWNAFYIDTDGEFHCLEATGSLGCKTLNKFLQNYADYEGNTDFYTRENISRFTELFHAGIVKGILHWLGLNTNWIIPDVTCNVCDSKVNLDEAEIDDTDFICYSCKWARDTVWTITFDDGRDIELTMQEINETRYEELWAKIKPIYYDDDILPDGNLSLPLEVPARVHNMMEEQTPKIVDFEWEGNRVVEIEYREDCW